MWLSENFTATAFKCRCNKRHPKLAKIDYSEASNSLLQIGRLAGRNGVY